jgi:ecdysteroid 25-hydroxylase CYP306A1
VRLSLATGRDVGEEVASRVLPDLHAREGEWLDLAPLLGHHIGNMMNRLIFGLEYERESGVWSYLQELREEGVKLIGVCGAVNFLPWLRFWPPSARNIRWIKEGQARTHQEYERIIRLVEDKLDQEQIEEDNIKGQEQMEADNITQLFIQEMQTRAKHGGDCGSFTREQLYYLQASNWVFSLKM